MSIVEEAAALKPNPEFGNGLSLKYYNFVHFVFIPGVILNGIYSLTNLLKIIGNPSGIYSAIAGTIVPWLMVFFYLVNVALDGLAVNYIVKKDPWKFSFWFLARFPISLVGNLVLPIVISSLFPEMTQAAASAMALSVFTVAIVFIPQYIYFTKRMKRVQDAA